MLERAFVLHAIGDARQAESLALAAWRLDQRHGAAVLLAGECAESQKQFARAVEWYGQVPPDDARQRANACFRAAKICHQKTYQLTQAERFYRETIELDPQNAEASARLANLLGLCGRGRELDPFVIRVLIQEQPTDLVMIMSREQVGIAQPELLEHARRAAPTDPNVMLGTAWAAVIADQSEAAIVVLKALLKEHPDNVPGWAMLGTQLWRAGRFDEVRIWAAQLPEAADDSASAWLVRGQLAEQDADEKGAIRCLGESVWRMPERYQARRDWCVCWPKRVKWNSRVSSIGRCN